MSKSEKKFLDLFREGIVYNAAGCRCTSRADLLDLATSYSSAVLTKSCTLLGRDGNEKPKYWDSGEFTINSNGLENLGYSSYLGIAKDVKDVVGSRKPYIMSVAGLSMDENRTILPKVMGSEHVDAIELNLSCPNIVGHDPISYSPETFDDCLGELLGGLERTKPFGLKLPPYVVSSQFDRVSEIIEKYEIDFITCVNSFPRGARFDSDGNPVIKNVLGGIGGGDFMRAIAMGQVRQFRDRLGPEIPIVMCGGISKREHIEEGLSAGANLFQIGTHLMLEGTKCFADLV